MKASSRRTFTTKAARGSDWAQEWEDVETVERLEALEAQVADLAAEPAGEPEVTAEPIGDLMSSLSDGPGPGHAAWWSMPLLAFLIVAPWTVIAVLVWLLTT
jgi:hypothetical protein